MAKLMSKQTKDTVLTSTVLVLIVAFIFFYIIYPLIYIDDMFTREVLNNFESPSQDSVATFDELGLVAETLTVITDDNIELASYYIKYDSVTSDTALGTVIILPSIFKLKEDYNEFAANLVTSGYNAIIYDQRGSGQSTGDFHTPGIYEAENLNQFLVWLKLHDRLIKPITVVGFYTGADAAIYASQEENYIDNIIAYRPYLTPSRWVSELKAKTGKLSIPFSNAVYFWWYQKSTGAAFERTGTDELKPAKAATLVIANDADISSDEYSRFSEISGDMLNIQNLAETGDDIYAYILRELTSAK